MANIKTTSQCNILRAKIQIGTECWGRTEKAMTNGLQQSGKVSKRCHLRGSVLGRERRWWTEQAHQAGGVSPCAKKRNWRPSICG